MKLSIDKKKVSQARKIANKLANDVTSVAKTHTTPSIERSVLIRMGFSSLEAKPLVEMAIDHGLIGKGSGHVVYVVSKEKGMSIREAGLALIEGEHWDFVLDYFNKRGEK